MQRTSWLAALAAVVLLVAAARDRDAHAEPSRTLELGFLFERHFGADAATLAPLIDWVSEYDLLVALHLERVSRHDRDTIIAWRRAGGSWDSITRRCGLACNIYYVAMPADTELHGPYERPYATWKAQPSVDQRLSDEEVRELVLLRVLRDAARLSAAEVARRRAAGATPRAFEPAILGR